MLALTWFLAVPPHTLMTHSEGNGGKPVYVVMSETFDFRLPARVQTHYHGDQATALEGDHMPRVLELIEADAQRVFVLPEAAGNVGKDSTNWTNATDQSLTTRDALWAAGVTEVSEYTVSAHSSGGRALARALARQSVQASRVVLLDCLYEPAATSIRDELLKKKDLSVVVVRGTNPEARVTAFANALGIATITSEGHSEAVRYVLDGRH